VLKLAVPTGVMHLMMNLAGTPTYRVIAPFGVATIAAFGVVSKVLGLAFTLPGGVILGLLPHGGGIESGGREARESQACMLECGGPECCAHRHSDGVGFHPGEAYHCFVQCQPSADC